jgi:hypothetical protein
MTSQQISNLATWIESVIRDFIEKSPDNTLQNKANDRAFDTPLVGFSSGNDWRYSLSLSRNTREKQKT